MIVVIILMNSIVWTIQFKMAADPTNFNVPATRPCAYLRLPNVMELLNVPITKMKLDVLIVMWMSLNAAIRNACHACGFVTITMIVVTIPTRVSAT